MTIADAEIRLRELHRDGERTRLSFDISAIGTYSYTVQRIVEGRVHTGCSLVDPADALVEANDSIVRASFEAQLVR